MIWWAILLINVALQAAAYLLTPKPKGPKPKTVEDFENPTASADREVPVVFGEVIVTGLNVVWYGDKSVRNYEVG